MIRILKINFGKLYSVLLVVTLLVFFIAYLTINPPEIIKSHAFPTQPDSITRVKLIEESEKQLVKKKVLLHEVKQIDEQDVVTQKKHIVRYTQTRKVIVRYKGKDTTVVPAIARNGGYLINIDKIVLENTDKIR